MSSALVPVPKDANLPAVTTLPPPLVLQAGRAAANAWRDFFDGELANENTRKTYNTALRQFSAWCEARGLELAQIHASDVGKYLRSLAPQKQGLSRKKVHRSAIRRYFDLLVERHICLINPAAVARTEKYQIRRGKTPEINPDEIVTLIGSVNTENIIGLRDRAAIAVLTATAARAGAIARLRRGDYRGRPGRMSLRFIEKGGNDTEIEVRHDLEEFLDEYLTTARMKSADKNTPLFRPVLRKENALRPWVPENSRRGTKERGAMTPNDMCRMIKRRIVQAGLRPELSAHSFRVAVLTDLLDQGVPIEDVQELAGHADARTTKLYDRTQRKATRNLVERIRLTV